MFAHAGLKGERGNFRAAKKGGNAWRRTYTKLLGMLQIMSEVLSLVGSKARLPPTTRGRGGGGEAGAGVALLQGVRTERGEKFSSASAFGDSSISAMLQRIAGSGGGDAHGKGGKAGGDPAE
jgi:hypothetical protein